MKNEIIIDVTKSNNKTLKELKKWVQNNPLNKAKKKIVLKNNDVIICTNF